MRSLVRFRFFGLGAGVAVLTLAIVEFIPLPINLLLFLAFVFLWFAAIVTWAVLLVFHATNQVPLQAWQFIRGYLVIWSALLLYWLRPVSWQ